MGHLFLSCNNFVPAIDGKLKKSHHPEEKQASRYSSLRVQNLRGKVGQMEAHEHLFYEGYRLIVLTAVAIVIMIVLLAETLETDGDRREKMTASTCRHTPPKILTITEPLTTCIVEPLPSFKEINKVKRNRWISKRHE